MAAEQQTVTSNVQAPTQKAVAKDDRCHSHVMPKNSATKRMTTRRVVCVEGLRHRLSDSRCSSVPSCHKKPGRVSCTWSVAPEAPAAAFWARVMAASVAASFATLRVLDW